MATETKRAGGVLMHISSLPGETGIGTLGDHAYAFVEYLKRAGQRYWQILPLGPTGFGDSPYQSASTFAGNPLLIDLPSLERDGFLQREEYALEHWGDDAAQVDFDRVTTGRSVVFERVFLRFRQAVPMEFEHFCQDNAFWLDDYALFMAIKDAHRGAPLWEWEEDIRTRQPQAMERWQQACADRVEYHRMLQYFFYKQWFALKRYANQNGVQIIGDLPIYVSADSADVWAQPKQFVLDGQLRPVEVAGCPPDAFSEDGQLWGNPIYDWEYHRRTKYAWWIRRLSMTLRIYDVVRIDHFRGFDSYYCIPGDADTARVGVWRKGPGMGLFQRVQLELGEAPIIAEDLGFLTDSVRELLKDSGFPGMKVLQFAFDPGGQSEYLPHRYPRNCVVYTGTHDNNTIRGWADTASPQEIAFAKQYLRVAEDGSLAEAMMVAAMASVADTCILTMQDLIGLDESGRMNVPSTVGDNWRWRATTEQIGDTSARFLWENTRLYGRLPS